MKKLTLLAIALFGLFLTACDKESVTPGQEVEVYLLKSFETVDQTESIKETGIQLQDDPLLTYSDLRSYTPTDHSFKLTEKGKEAVLGSDYDHYKKAFAVVVDDEIIYTGYFWSSFSSSSCQWIVADLTYVEFHDELKMDLGYPGLIDGVEIPDNRNDNRILAVFKRDGKLVP